ncbi:MAG: T9SS type A sorting domain-containing protein [Bacteroidia bacterium]
MNHIASFLFAALCLVKLIVAQPGSLDQTFGNAGRLTTDFYGRNDMANALKILPDGRILAAGYTSTTNFSDTDFAFAMYLPDGSLDPGFGTGGLNQTSIGGFDEIKALAVQPDGKILAAGTRKTGANLDFAIARYMPNASLDNEFGTFFGVTTTNLGTNQDKLAAIALQPDGKILAAGGVGSGDDANFVLVRYTSSGLPDSTFGTNGIAITDFDDKYETAYAMAIQSDRKIVVVGRGYHLLPPYDEAFAVARYMPDGTLDASFGTGGKQTIRFTGFVEWANAVAVLPSGKIVVAGHAHYLGLLSFAIARMNPDGSMDPTFGTNGRAIFSLGSWSHNAGLVVLPDGKYIMGGFGAAGEFSLVRINTNGQLDSTFTDGVPNNGGMVLTSFGSDFSQINALAVQADGKVVAAGGAGNNFALARYITDSNVGIDRNQFEVGSVKVYPNPVKEQAVLTFSLREPQRVEVSLFDSQGRRISIYEKQSYPAGKHEMNLHFPTELTDGLYIVQIITGSGQTFLKVWK